jgi:UDP-3-O-[3-hydroxymyristoyl] glucosamine N-acyltransferase
VIGRHCLIVSQTGLSGSVTVGDRCVFGGQVGIADNLTIGEDSQIAAKAGVMSNLPPGGRWAGAPAVPIREFMRAEALRQKMLRPNAVVLEKESGS